MAFYIYIDRKILTGLPIVSGYYVKEDWTLVKNFTKAFYMDPKFGKPPAPINPSVRIIPWPSQTYYVAAYVKQLHIYACIRNISCEIFILGWDYRSNERKAVVFHFYFF